MMNLFIVVYKLHLNIESDVLSYNFIKTEYLFVLKPSK